MLANGPPCTKAGLFSSVWTRFGISASLRSTVIAPGALMSLARTWPLSRLAAAGGTPFHAEARTERRFAQRDHCLAADAVEAVAETHRGGRLAFTRWGRVDGGDQYQLPILLGLQ